MACLKYVVHTFVCLSVCLSVCLNPQEMKALQVDNQRLKDENTALIRVIAKMSRSPGINS